MIHSATSVFFRSSLYVRIVLTPFRFLLWSRASVRSRFGGNPRSTTTSNEGRRNRHVELHTIGEIRKKEAKVERILPRYRWGDIAPRESSLQRGPTYQFYRIVPPDVMIISVGLGIRDYTPELVEEAMPNFWDRVNRLVAEHVDHIILAGAPISAQLGRPRVRSLLREMEEKTGLPSDAPIEAVISAMQHLGLRKIA